MKLMSFPHWWRAASIMTATSALLGGLAVIAPAAGAAPSQAARTVTAHAVAPSFGCSGYGCDNTDPKATGCWDSSAYHAGSASIYDQVGDYLGYVVNWYSGDCGTNWSETFTAGGVPETITVWTTRGSYSTDHYTIHYSYAWSNQVYAPNAVACAEGTINVNNKFIGHNASCV